MKGFAALVVCVFVLAGASAMPQDVSLATKGEKMRLREMSPEMMEEIVDMFRREVASRTSLEIAEFLDESMSAPVFSVGADCNQNGAKITCCVEINAYVPFIGKIDTSACFVGEYVPREVGVRVKLTVGGDTLINELLSARDPPNICVKVPAIPGRILSICLDASDLKINNNKFHGCFALKARAIYITVLDVNLGCFDL